MAVLTNPTDLARETLKLLATRRIAPTPENYQRYYHEIAGTAAHRESAEERLGERLREVAKANPALVPLTRLTRLLDEGDLAAFTAQLVAIASGREAGARHDWGALLRELLRSLEARQTGGSLARKKDGLERLLIHFGTDPQLFDKLQALMRSWSEVPEATATVVELDPEPLPVRSTPASAAPRLRRTAPGRSRNCSRSPWRWAWPRGWSAFPSWPTKLGSWRTARVRPAASTPGPGSPRSCASSSSRSKCAARPTPSCSMRCCGCWACWSTTSPSWWRTTSG